MTLSLSGGYQGLASSCTEIEQLKHTAQKVYTGQQLRDVLAQLDKKCLHTGTGSSPQGKELGGISFAAPVCTRYFSVLNCAIRTQAPLIKQAAYQESLHKHMQSWASLSVQEQQFTCQSAREKKILPDLKMYQSYGCAT